MKVDKDVHDVWIQELDQDNIYEHAKQIGSDVRTVINARDTGKCHKRVAEKINKYIIKKIKKRSKNPFIGLT